MRILVLTLVTAGLVFGCSIWKPLEAPRSGLSLMRLELPTMNIDTITVENKEETK